MNYFFKKTLNILLLVVGLGLYAQEKDKDKENAEGETLGTETVVIVKAYTPAISDANKLKAEPTENDSIVLSKKAIQYQINSIPVASTFTPAKGEAAKVEKPKNEKLYDNYATLGLGNYINVLGEFYSNFELNRSDNFGVYLQHNSSQGGIKDVQLDNKYYDTDLNLNFSSRKRDMSYGIDLGLTHQLYNWYGLPSDLILTEEALNAIDPKQTYFGVAVGGNIAFEDAIFKEAGLKYRYFRDAYKSSENHFVAKPTFGFPIGDEQVTARLILDYASGDFGEELNIAVGDSSKYSIFNIGFHPSFTMRKEDLTLNIGAAAFVSLDAQNDKNRFLFYPKVTASYRLVDEMVIAYAGLEGDLIQNTYYKTVQENPFVGPGLLIAPTNQQLNGYLGLKGRITNGMGYNLKAGYVSEKGRALFVKNTTVLSTDPEIVTQNYNYGNTFGYVYDDVNTVSATAGLNFDVKSNFKLGVEGTFYSYATDEQAEAWNLPSFKAAILANYQITPKWYFDTQLYFIGERKALFTPTTALLEEQVVTLDSYFDANMTLGYRFSDRLSFFIKGNNLAGNSYQKWLDYPVLGLQVMGGATYKFDW